MASAACAFCAQEKPPSEVVTGEQGTVCRECAVLFFNAVIGPRREEPAPPRPTRVVRPPFMVSAVSEKDLFLPAPPADAGGSLGAMLAAHLGSPNPEHVFTATRT